MLETLNTLLAIINLIMSFFLFRKFVKEKLWCFVGGLIFLAISEIFSVIGLEQRIAFIKILLSGFSFCFAIGLVQNYYERLKIWWTIILFSGFILIVMKEFSFSKQDVEFVVFNLFSDLTIVIIPIFAITQMRETGKFFLVALAGFILGLLDVEFYKNLLQLEIKLIIYQFVILFVIILLSIGFGNYFKLKRKN